MIYTPLLVFALEQESRGLFNKFDVLHTGVGKLNAAYHLTKKLSSTAPSIVINLGSAGSATIPTGSVVAINKFMQRDMDVTALGFEPGQTPFSNDPVILEYGETWSGSVGSICGTGDNFDISHTGALYDIVDMEAYALAKVCKFEAVPFFCLKYISDGADGAASKDWEVALDEGARSLERALLSFIESRNPTA